MAESQAGGDDPVSSLRPREAGEAIQGNMHRACGSGLLVRQESWRGPAGASPARVSRSGRPIVSVARSPVTAAAKRTPYRHRRFAPRNDVIGIDRAARDHYCEPRPRRSRADLVAAPGRAVDTFHIGKICRWMHNASDSADNLLRPDTADSRTARMRAILNSRAGVAIVAIALLAPSIVWVFRDVHVWPWDQAYYAALALRIGYALHDGPLAWLSSFLTVPDSRAPLLPWLAQATMPMIDLLGGPERALLLANLAAGLVGLCLVYSATRQFGGTSALGLLAMLAGAGTPDFVALNHQFLVEAVQAVTVIAVALVALRADCWSWVRLAAGALLSVSFALLAKTTTAAYVAPFLLYVGIVCAASKQPRPPTRPADFFLLWAGVLLAGMTVAWYAMHWSAVVSHVKEATSGDVALLYGSTGPLVTKLGYWWGALLQALSPFFWLAVAFIVVIALEIATACLRVSRGPPRAALRDAIKTRLLFALCLAGTVVAGLFGYAKTTGEDVRFIAPMVPLVALLLAWSLVTLRNRWLMAGAAILLAANWTAVHAGGQGLVKLPEGSLDYLQAPKMDIAATNRMTRALREACDKAGRIIVIGPSLQNFSIVSAWLYSEKLRRGTGYRCECVLLGYFGGGGGRAFQVIYESGADVFVTLPANELPAPGTDRFDRVSRPVAEWIATSADFQRVTPEGDVLVIYRRRR